MNNQNETAADRARARAENAKQYLEKKYSKLKQVISTIIYYLYSILPLNNIFVF
jgi:hypothetical protein